MPLRCGGEQRTKGVASADADGVAMAYRPTRYEQVMKASECFDVRARKIFGGMGVYTGEKMFAILMDDVVSFKLSPEDRQAVLSMEGACLFRPAPDKEPMPEYVVMPQKVLDDEQEFLNWLKRSAEYARSKSRTAH
jgi:DNA transformation protein